MVLQLQSKLQRIRFMHGDNQSITITVVDKLTKKGLEKASIDGWVSDSSGDFDYIFLWFDQ